MEHINHNNEQDIVNPEVPQTPAEKLELLNRCVRALERGLVVEGITPKHIGGTEGMYNLERARLSDTPRVRSGL